MRLLLGDLGLYGRALLAGIILTLFIPGCARVNVQVKTGECAKAGEGEGEDGAAGCLKRVARAGDYANDGTACTSGYACKVVGALCDPNNSNAHCTTIHTGGGSCNCSCQ